MLKIFECAEMDKNEQCTLHIGSANCKLQTANCKLYIAHSTSKHKRLTEIEDENFRKSKNTEKEVIACAICNGRCANCANCATK